MKNAQYILNHNTHKTAMFSSVLHVGTHQIRSIFLTNASALRYGLHK